MSQITDKWGTVHQCQGEEGHTGLCYEVGHRGRRLMWQGPGWRPGKWIRRVFVESAVRYDGTNAAELEQFGTVELSRELSSAEFVPLTLHLPARPRVDSFMIFPGQWVVRFSDGRVAWFDAQAFEREFRINPEWEEE